MKSLDTANETERKVINIVENFQLTHDDFNPKTGQGNIVHEAMLFELRKGFWEAEKVYVQHVYMNIDLTVREVLEVHSGRIILALELDTEDLNPASVDKLADVRANNKCWILVTKRKRYNTARKNFEECLDFIKRSLKRRNETKEDFGNFIAILKTPECFEVERIF